MQAVGQRRSSSQVEALGATGSSALLDAWGSQDHSSCQLLLSPSDVASLMFGGKQGGPAPQAEHLATAGASAGQANAAADGLRACSESGLHHLQQLYNQQSQKQQGLKAIIYEDAGYIEPWECLHWQLQQKQHMVPQQHQQPSYFANHQQQQSQYTHRQEPLLCTHASMQQQHQLQLEQQSPAKGIPFLDLSRVKVGSSQPVRNLPDSDVETPNAAAKAAELCFEAGSIREHQLHPNALLQDSRCYIYKAIGKQELNDFQHLLSRLPAGEQTAVSALWDALLVARHDCEVMAARGVRVSRDISRDWQETVSDLIDRVVAQDQELAQLKQQLKSAQVAAQAAAPNGSDGAHGGLEELHAQVVRLKRQSDKLSRDQQELTRTLGESQQAEQMAKQEAAEAREQLNAVKLQAHHLREQHKDLLHRNMELAIIADSLERQVESLEAAAAAAAAGAGGQVLQLAAGMQTATGGRYIPASTSSGGGVDQPGSDQTSFTTRPRSPAPTAKPGLAGVKSTGRQSPFADEMQQLHSPRAAAHAASRTGKVYSLTASSNAGALGHKSAVGQHSNAAHSTGGEAEHSHSMGNSITTAFTPLLGFKGLSPMVWGSGGGASHTSSNGGAVGRSSLGLSSTGGDSSSGLAHSGAVSVDAAGTAAARVSVPRSSDDTLDTSGMGVNHGYTTTSKEVDQFDQQMEITTRGIQSGLPLAPGMLGGFAAAGAMSGVANGVAGVYGAMQTSGLSGSKPHSRLMVQQRVIGVVPSVLSADSHNDWQKEIESVRQQLQTMEAMSFL